MLVLASAQVLRLVQVLASALASRSGLGLVSVLEPGLPLEVAAGWALEVVQVHNHCRPLRRTLQPVWASAWG